MTRPMRILALIPEPTTARRCLEFAWLLASIVAADVEAFHVKVDPDRLGAPDEEVAIQRLRSRREGTAEARAQAVRTIFASWRDTLASDQLHRVTWREVVGIEENLVTRESVPADLIVLPAPHNLDGGDAEHAAFRKSHRPMLFVPDAATAKPFGQHIAIGWKPTPQAGRAVEGAAVWLRFARRVTAIMVAKDLEHAGWAQAERLLLQLGVTADPLLVAPSTSEVGVDLLRTAHELDADSLVLGAFRHVDVVEWVLPSTTRHLLHHADIPLFLAH